MPKLLPRITLFITALAVLFGLFLLPTTADRLNTSSILNDNISSPEVAPLISAQVTFTPVVTIYLPIVFIPLSEDLEVNIELPDGYDYNPGDEVKVIITVSSSLGVDSFIWGLFTQNQVPLTGGDVDCFGSSICQREKSFSAPPSGTYIVGVEALDSEGDTQRSLKEIYVH